jgi:hypothetical protein
MQVLHILKLLNMQDLCFNRGIYILHSSFAHMVTVIVYINMKYRSGWNRDSLAQ